MRPYSIARLLGAFIALPLLAACGGGAGTSVPAVGDEPDAGLTNPSMPVGAFSVSGPIFPVVMQPQHPEQLPLRGASWVAPRGLLGQLSPLPDKDPACTGSGFLMAGGDYSDELPHNKVSREGADDQLARFAPDWSGGSTQDAAFAVYRWNLRGFTGAQTMGFSWVEGEEPATWQNFWVGLGDLGRDSWDWFRGPQDNVLTIESFGPYRAASGEMLMIILLLSTDEAALAKMEAGVPEQRATGEVDDLPGDAPEYPPLSVSGSLPSAVDLSGECAPINDQLTWGSCTAFAVGDGAFNFELGRVYGPLGWDLTRDHYRVSPKYLYLKSGERYGYPPGGDYGRWTAEVIQTLQAVGIASEANAPYDLVYAQNWSDEADADAAALSCDAWEEIPCNTREGIATVKAVLARQRKPLPMRIYLDYSFFDYTGEGVWFPLGSSVGGHAMCIVGYDDQRGSDGAFKVRNSWGEYWGDAGHVWIDYVAFLLPGTSVRTWTLSEDYSAAVVQRFGLSSPGTPPPVGVEASDGTSTQYIQLTWADHPWASVFHVYRDEQDNQVASINGAVTSWQDQSVTDSFGHIYWVQADSSMLSAPDVGYLAALPEVLSVEPTSATEGEYVAFVAAGTGSGPLYYDWNFGGGGTPNTSQESRPIVQLGAPGLYDGSVTVSNALGEDVFQFELTVRGVPPLVSHVSGKSGYSGDQTTLSAALEGTATDYSWEFSGGATPSTSTSSAPIVTLGEPGIYDASLEVSSPDGSDTFYFRLAVLDPALTAWTLPGRDPRASGQSPVTGPQTSNLKWKYYAGIWDSTHGSRVKEVLVLDDGSLIVASNTGSGGTSLRRLNPDGTPVWSRLNLFEDAEYEQPIIGAQSGNLYVAFEWSVLALDVGDGAELWTYTPEEAYGVSPRVETAAGLLYVVGGGKYLFALDSEDGSREIEPVQLADGYNSVGQAVLAPSGMLFISSEFAHDDLLIAFDTIEGVPRGTMMTMAPAASLSLSADGLTLFVADAWGSTWAYDTYSCRQLWRQNETCAAFYGLMDVRVRADGAVIVANQNSDVFALDPDTGEIIWDYGLGLEGDCRSAPAIGRDGTVYLGGSNRKLYAIRDDALIWESADADTWYFNGDPSIGPDGTLYCGADDGWLYAFGAGSGNELIPAYVIDVTPVEGDEGEEVTFIADVVGNAPLAYSWNFGGGAVPNTSSEPSPTVTLGDVGTYGASLALSNVYGSHTYEFTLRVFIPGGNTPPIADLQADVTTGDPPLTVTFDASGSTDLEAPIDRFEFAADDGYQVFHDNGTDPYYSYVYGAPGTYEATVVVYDSDGLFDSAALTITISGGEKHVVTINNGNDGGVHPRLAEVNGRPAISYRHQATGNLKFQRAEDANGASWGSIVAVDSSCTGGIRDSLVVVDGNPAIAYVDSSTKGLKYVRATDQNGASWGSPIVVAANVTTGDGSDVKPCMVMVAGNPGLTFYDTVNHKQLYIRADSTDGSTWGAGAVEIYDAGSEELRGQSMGIIGGRPAILMDEYTSREIIYVRAGNADGSSWGTVYDVADGRVVYGSLIDASGLPAFSFFTATPSVYHLRASNVDGSAWAAPTLIAEKVKTGRWATHGNLLYGNGQYWCVYVDDGQDRAWERRSFELSGASWTDQIYLTSSMYSLSAAHSLSMINGNFSAVFHDISNGAILFVTYY